MVSERFRPLGLFLNQHVVQMAYTPLAAFFERKNSKNVDTLSHKSTPVSELVEVL